MAEETVTKPDLWAEAPPLSAPKLLGAGVRLIRRKWRALAGLALALAAATVAVRLAARAVGAATAGADLTLESLAYEALVAAATGLVSGLMLRVLLAEGRARLAADRGLLGYAGLSAAAGLLSALVAGVVTGADPSAGLVEALRVPLGALTLLVLVFVFARLILWPIGVLMGEPALTPGRSWVLMGGAVWAYVLALVLAFLALLPIYVVLMVPMAGDADTAPVVFVVVEHLATAAWVAVCAGVAAALWRARVEGRPFG